MGSTLAEIRATIESLKGNLRSEMKALEAELVKVPFPEWSLVIKLGSAEYYWGEIRIFYDRLQILTKDESLAYEKLQTRYEDLHARVEDALEDYFQDKEARK